MDTKEKQIAKEAVMEVLTMYGLDHNAPLEMQEDFAWIRKMRRTSEKVGGRIVLTLVTIITVGLASLVWTKFGGE